MLDGIRSAINTVVFATPILGTGIAFLVATTPARGAGVVTRAVGGGIAGATVASMWEFTVNNSDPPGIKTEIIMGSAGIGAAAGVVGPTAFRASLVRP
tara:strand:+ start:292 stop:585 length:294 start_codon:yes stop_codon:yes gene_type:complete